MNRELFSEIRWRMTAWGSVLFVSIGVHLWLMPEISPYGTALCFNCASQFIVYGLQRSLSAI